MICSSCSIIVSLSPLGLYISSLPVSHSSCHCLYVTFCLAGSACEGLQKGREQWLMINSQHLASHEITGWMLRVLDSICVINSIFGKMAGNVIIGEEMNAANLFENLNRIWQTEMWNLGEEIRRLKKKEKVVWCGLISERMYFSTWKKKLLISNWHLKSYLQVKDRKLSQSK